MDHTEIQTKVNALSDLMIAKGMTTPSVEFKVSANTSHMAVWFSWCDDAKKYKCEFKGGHGPEEALSNAYDWLVDQPGKDERQRADYRKAVADAIDLGRKFGIEDAAINPLREVMDKLSKHALEYHGRVLEGNVQSSDIPF